MAVSDHMTPEGIKFQQTLKELNKLMVCIGFQSGEAENNGVDICGIAAWNELGTDSIPSRPFMRESVDENQDKINTFLQEKINDIIGGATAEQVLKEIGIFQKDLIQEKILNGDFEPNNEATINKKKSAKPLIDTGRMLQTVNYFVKAKEGGSN